MTASKSHQRKMLKPTMSDNGRSQFDLPLLPTPSSALEHIPSVPATTRLRLSAQPSPESLTPSSPTFPCGYFGRRTLPPSVAAAAVQPGLPYVRRLSRTWNTAVVAAGLRPIIPHHHLYHPFLNGKHCSCSFLGQLMLLLLLPPSSPLPSSLLFVADSAGVPSVMLLLPPY